MFTVIVAEKGGGKQTLQFDEEVLTIGRVQGNQIILPRGNVSKKHAKLEYRAGEFRLTDLNSTNGTYINGRRITGSTLVKPGDKVYLGEFILGFETSGEVAPSAPEASPPVAPSPPSAAAPQPKVPRPKGPRPPVVKPAKPSKPLAPPRPVKDSTVDDEDDSFSSVELDSVPKAPRPGSAEKKSPRASSPEPKAKSAAATIATPTVPAGGERAELMEGLVDAVSRQVKRVERGKVPVALDEGTAGKVRIIVADLVEDMVARGKLPPTIESGQLPEDAFREIVDLGPLSVWLGDEDVREIRITTPESIHLLKAGGWEDAPAGFTGEEELAEKLRCLGSGVTGRDEGGVAGLTRYRLQDGTMALVALAPVGSSGPSAHLFKNLSARLRHGENLDMMDDGPAREFIEKGIADRARFAVVGSILPYRLSVLTDMVRLLPVHNFVVGVEDIPYLGFRGSRQVGLAAHGMRKSQHRTAGIGSLLPRAIDLNPDWLVVCSGWWDDVGEILSCGTGHRGLMAELPLTGDAPDRELMAGLAAAGMVQDLEGAAALLANAFDYLVVVGCSEAGRPVVERILGTGMMGDKWMAKTVYER